MFKEVLCLSYIGVVVLFWDNRIVTGSTLTLDVYFKEMGRSNVPAKKDQAARFEREFSV